MYFLGRYDLIETCLIQIYLNVPECHLERKSLWLLPFFMAMAAYCYYEKVRTTMRIAFVSYLLRWVLFINSFCILLFMNGAWFSLYISFCRSTLSTVVLNISKEIWENLNKVLPTLCMKALLEIFLYFLCRITFCFRFL